MPLTGFAGPVTGRSWRSTEIAKPSIEGIPLPDEPLIAHQELLLADPERLLPIPSIAIAVDALPR
jgi:hypothetical protein